MRREMVFLVLSLFLLGGIAGFVASTASDPIAARTLDVVTSEKNDDYTLIHETAEAGNITTMNITGWSQTQTWSGFVGNVTGRIVLDDANNKSLYEWFSAEPQGEIYAANTSGAVNWDNIKCFSFANNRTAYEASLGLDAIDYDGVDETFNATNHPSLWVGTHTLVSCPTTNMFTSDAVNSTRWYEVLLHDGKTPVYTAIIEDDTANTHSSLVGFDGKVYDYQMVVGVNGHDGSDSKWEYYFYVELE